MEAKDFKQLAEARAVTRVKLLTKPGDPVNNASKLYDVAYAQAYRDALTLCLPIIDRLLAGHDEECAKNKIRGHGAFVDMRPVKCTCPYSEAVEQATKLLSP